MSIEEQKWKKYMAEKRIKWMIVETWRWNHQGFIDWLRTQLKDQYKNEEIKVRNESGQIVASCRGWLLAYFDSMTVFLWRGNPVSIHYPKDIEAEREANDGRISPEYYCWPE